MSWRPTAALPTLRLRAELLAAARQFFADRRVLEVDTPALVRHAVTDLHIHSAQVQLPGHRSPLFLHTSPEYAMKRLLAAGSGDIYQIAHVFRGEESGRLHNAEFTLIEWYRCGYSMQQLMQEVAQLARLLLGLTAEAQVEPLSYAEAFQRTLGCAPLTASDTVLRALDGKLYGFNTDVAGITGPLEKRMPLSGARVLVLGAGGAARAAVFGLREKGASVFILNRTAETAQKLARQSGSKTIRKDALAKTTFDAIVNATPVGMAGNKAAPLLEARDLNTRLVFDLVYNPLETPLIHLARQLSIPFITGIEMFVHQGARQFEIFTGKPAPEEEMFRVVLHALRRQAEADAAEAAESKPEPKPAARPKSETKSKPSAKPVGKPAARPKSEPKPTPSAKSPAKPAAKAKSSPKPKPSAKPKSQAKPVGKQAAAKAKK